MRPSAVLGQTGTMYDGGNANLQLPPEQNAYWMRLWAEPGTEGNAGASSVVGAGTAGSSLGGRQVGAGDLLPNYVRPSDPELKLL